MQYVDQGLFGQGNLIQDNHDLNQFQLTCYDRKVPRVDWYEQGVVYQIFPDRFANGNPHGEITGRKRIVLSMLLKKMILTTLKILAVKLFAGTSLVAI